MTKTTEELVAEDIKQVEELIHEHPELADDVELGDIKDIEERLEFIVPQTDDPSTPAFTFRAVLLGTIWCGVLSYANTVLSFRSNVFAIGANIAVILSYPMGLFLAAVLPRGFLNPGPFSIKEHALIYVMSAVSGQPYGIDNVVAQAYPKLMNNAHITFIEAFAFVLVTQFIGYGMSGLTRRFLVKPTAMWWPSNLAILAIFSSFHKVETGETQGIKHKTSRFVMFWIFFVGMFVYTWIPEFFMPVLQTVSVLCLFSGYGINNNGVPQPAGQLTTFNAVAGSTTNGVGIFGLTFDWVYLGSAYLTSPFWAVACNLAGSVVLGWIITPIIYATDVWGLNSMMSYSGNPWINSARLFIGNPENPNVGHPVSPRFFYNASDNYNLNQTAYNLVAPVHITSLFAMTYASSFLVITSAITHVFLWYGPNIYRQTLNAFRQIKDSVDANDKHAKMMEAYPDVPDMFYLIFLAICVLGAVLVSIFTEFGMPWWGIFFNIFCCAMFLLPFGVIQAISGFGLGLNVFTEFIIGLMLPGQTVAVMAFKSWGTNNLIQSLSLSQDLKLGQYLHIPPYAMVASQFWGTFINSLVATGSAWYMMFDSGSLLGSDGWGYNSYQVFYSAGGIWGAIGPQRFFGIGSLYQNLLWCFLVGAILPVLPWLANKYVVQSKYWHYINFPLFFTFTGAQTPYQNTIVVPLFISWYASVYLFRKDREYYEKYVYVIGAALDGSSAFATVIISIMAVFNATFNNWNIFNPNGNNPAGPYGAVDYYCWPDRDYNDYGCEYYLAQGANQTSDGTSCLIPSN